MPKRSPTTSELMTVIKLASLFGVAGLVAVAMALGVFVYTAAAERQEICEVVVRSVRGNAEALIDATANSDRTSEEADRYAETVAAYRARLDEALQGCE